eukprot:9498924-Pyramimonas_sp.AAC.1
MRAPLSAPGRPTPFVRFRARAPTASCSQLHSMGRCASLSRRTPTGLIVDVAAAFPSLGRD